MIVTADWEIDHEDEVRERLYAASAPYRRRFGIELHDVYHEFIVWYLGDGARHVERWRDEEHGKNKLLRAARNLAVRYCESVKAAAVGYSVDDLHWYSSDQVEAILPLVLEGYELPGRDDGQRRASNPAEGGNIAAMVADVTGALDALSREDADLVRAVTRGDPDELRAIAEQRGILAASLRRQYTRALTRLIRTLGGTRPEVPGGTT